MESRTVELTSRYNGEVKANTIKGHFATKHSHVSHCLDTTRVKSELRMARAAAKSFAEQFSYTPVDTVLTLERTKMIGAFLARDLYNGGINLHHDIAVVTPEITDDKMILRDNLIQYLKGKHVLLMTASATTGMTILAALEGIRYYQGEPVGVATIFGSCDKIADLPVTRLFGVDDIQGYESYSKTNCPLCKAGVKVDAVVNSYGYSKI